jgi:hypothetical protein
MSTTQTVAMTRKELETFAVQSWGFGKVSLRRMSTLLLAQLFQMSLRGDETVDRMAREVQCLENRGSVGYRLEKATGAMGLTQEWVVFKTHCGTNYYLTTASMDEGDRLINRRVDDACDFDFPFLQEGASFGGRFVGMKGGQSK